MIEDHDGDGPSRPLLSVLIPAFNYPHGVLRILRQLAELQLHLHEIEVIISDDSRDDGLREPSSRMAAALGLQLRYVHNVPALGAVGNWNFLLDQGRGRYQWLIHHDEFPLTLDTVPRLLEVLRGNDSPEAVLLDCVLCDPEKGQAWSHVPNWLRRVVAFFMPGFLWYRNAFGPTAALVLRRDRYPRFDPELRWLVDVDLYTRALAKNLKLVFLPGLSIGSVLNRKDSITAQIGAAAIEIETRERAYLIKRQGVGHPGWLVLQERPTLLAAALLSFFRAAWFALSKLTRQASDLGLGAHSIKELKAGLKTASSDQATAEVHSNGQLREDVGAVVPAKHPRAARMPELAQRQTGFTLLENVIANYAYLIVVGLSTLVATPIYVRSLGSSEWGMVALCMTLQGVLLMLDLGLTQVMPREVVRHGKALAGQVHGAFLKLFGLPAVLVGVGGQLFAPQIAEYLIGNVPHLPDFTVAVRLALVQFMFQFSNNAAIGLWNGLEMQRTASVRLATFGLAKHGLAVLLITQWAPQVLSYMLAFATVCGVEFMSNWWRIRRAWPPPLSGAQGGSSIDLRATLRSVAGFGVAALIGMLTGQIDRIFLAGSVPTEAYGIYVVCANLALAMTQLNVPLHRAFAPRLMAPDQSLRSLGQLFAGVCAFYVTPCLVSAWAATPILELWIGQPAVVEAGAPVLRWLLVAMAMSGVYSVAHLLMIKQDNFGRLAALNAVILLCQVGFLMAYGREVGLMAGAVSWVICGGLQMLAGCLFMAHYLSRRGKQASRAAS